MDRARIERQIEHGVAALRLAGPAGLAPQLADYLELLAKWSRTYNLTAVRVPEEMVTRHVIDSLAILPFIGDDRVLDVGSGAGLPGLVLAMAKREQRFVLLDSAGKRTRFMEHAVTRLGLGNVDVVRARVEAYEDETGFAVVLSRAFSSLGDFIRHAGHLVRPGGRLLAMKGALPEDELAAVPEGWHLRAVYRLTVPGLPERRHLLEFGAGSRGA